MNVIRNRLKIGFLITDSSDLTFLYPFITNLGPDNATILYDDRDKSKSLYGNSQKFVERKLSKKFKEDNYISISELFESKSKFDLLISIHPYIIHDFKKFAKINFRLSYSISKNTWQFGEINSYYNLIFTQGPYSSYLIKANYGIPCVEVGYPRYQIKDTSDSDYADMVNFKRDLPLITIFPPIGSLVVKNAEQELEKLNKIYNIVIKVHPIETKELLSYYQGVRNKFLLKFEDDGLDISNESLINHSDLVIHERGGTCFSSLYFKRNFAFFERDDQDVENEKIYKLDAEDILYKLVNRSISISNLSKDISKFLQSPIDYDDRFKRISNIFITKRANSKFEKAIRMILKYENSLVKRLLMSKRINVLRKFIYNIGIHIFYLKINRLLKDR